MRYFTAEMWEGWQSQDDDEAVRWVRYFGEARQSYEAQLPPLLARLSPRAAEFFDVGRHSLHDGSVTAWEVTNLTDFRQPPTLCLRVEADGVGKQEHRFYAYELTYRRVTGLCLQPTITPPGSNRLGTWGYDELIDAGDGALTHNVLFDSGRTLHVTFAHFAWRRRRAQWPS